MATQACEELQGLELAALDWRSVLQNQGPHAGYIVDGPRINSF